MPRLESCTGTTPKFLPTAGGTSRRDCWSPSAAAQLSLGSRTDTFKAERHRPGEPEPGSRVIREFLSNPVVVYYWLRHGGLAIFRITAEYVAARFAKRRPAAGYVIANLYHEVLVHHLTRFALLRAMKEEVPVIYACFYTYDEAAHAFGPDDENTLRVLKHLDHTIRMALEGSDGQAGGALYDVVILSDHGQVECRPFNAVQGKSLGEYVSEWLPTHEVRQYRGITCGPVGTRLDGHVVITYSGGLAHIYFRDISWRLTANDVEDRYPGLIGKLAALPAVGFALTKSPENGFLHSSKGQIELKMPLSVEARTLLSPLDDAEVVASQLIRLNSFERSGDVIVFGAYDGRRQVNFENQVGGHGSVGGDQLHPFLLVKKDWQVDTSDVLSAADLHPVLRRIRHGSVDRSTDRN